jgi:hypothetical protein
MPSAPTHASTLPRHVVGIGASAGSVLRAGPPGEGLADTDIWQLYLNDPDGARVEQCLAGAEAS